MSNPKLVYNCLESDSQGDIRSWLKTTDPFVAMADALLKAKKPYGLTANKKDFAVTQSDVFLGPLKEELINSISLTMQTKITTSKIIHSLYSIDTFFMNKNLEEGFLDNSKSCYKGPKYETSLNEIAARLKYASRGSVTFGKVFVVMASTNTSHSFWESPFDGEKTAKYAYKNRWNKTNWSGWF